MLNGGLNSVNLKLWIDNANRGNIGQLFGHSSAAPLSHNHPIKTKNKLQYLRINQMPGRIQLSQCQLVMVLIVQHIHQIGVERMYIVQLGEVLNDLRQPIVEVLLSVFHLAHIKRTDPADFIMLVDHRRSFPLGLR